MAGCGFWNPVVFPPAVKTWRQGAHPNRPARSVFDVPNWKGRLVGNPTSGGEGKGEGGGGGGGGGRGRGGGGRGGGGEGGEREGGGGREPRGGRGGGDGSGMEAGGEGARPVERGCSTRTSRGPSAWPVAGHRPTDQCHDAEPDTEDPQGNPAVRQRELVVVNAGLLPLPRESSNRYRVWNVNAHRYAMA